MHAKEKLYSWIFSSFCCCDWDAVHYIDLNKPDKAAFINQVGEVLETSMDDIELDIVQEYYRKNSKFIEE